MGDGTIRDNTTGLIWLKDASCGELPGVGGNGNATWENANAAARALAEGVCGLADGSMAGDWRLPTIEEWEALVSRIYYNPALTNTAGNAQWVEGDAFSGVQSTYYWSSTSYNSDYIWYINLNNASKNTGYISSSSPFVWPVRSAK